ncbi:MAG: cobalamin-dependent protein, partial [Candidatus Burarchaeum sp.]
MAKIALIVPPLRANSGDYKKAAESVGVQDLASMLVAEGHKVLIIDSALEGFKNLRSDEGWTKEYGLPDEGIVWRIREFSPDLIGLSSIATSQFISLIKTAKLLKSNFPDTPIVAGGAGADGLPELTLYASRGAIDAVCIHEGYTWLSEVVKELENGLSLGDILSALIGSASLNKEGNYMQVIAITRKGQENDEEVLHAIACGASLYSLELQGLINRDIKARSYARPERNPDITATYPRTSKPTYADRQPEGTLYIDVFFSLGCPNACTFCATHSRQGSLKDECGQLRLYELDKIRDFLKQMKERGFSHLIFQD